MMGTRLRRHDDRLSALPDATLAHILSHLSTLEAARTSVLSRRCNRVHASVPVVDLVHDGNRGRRFSRTRTCFDHQLLRSLRYKGGLPPPDKSLFLSLANHTAVTALTVDICECIDEKKPHEVATVTRLVAACANLTFLHLALRPAMVYRSSLFTNALRGLSRLSHLELKGCLPSDHSVCSVAVMLQNTPNLEVLSLFPLLPDPPQKKKARRYISDEDDNDKNGDDYSGNVLVLVPKRVTSIAISCFEQKLRRVNIVGYRGRLMERMLAKFLLSKATALEEFSVSLPPGRAPQHKDDMELTYWRANHRTKVTCA
ncbi:hypothetical protein PR202_gb21074 [Eleusine coracana subsp. coracana]|uniref:F-box domain-containing protein n=1 Tax=Eleusine coracana subsp. coracana TaxID=191504 RepID=A0AAV5FDU6_ELECO|nr:hypothetical protein PR202_gb21074 [Eleusine coracana subsp. coracana]